MTMKTPESPEALNLVLEVAGVDAPVRKMIEQYAAVAWRQGYLYGQRDMKQRVENAVAGLRVDTE